MQLNSALLELVTSLILGWSQLDHLDSALPDSMSAKSDTIDVFGKLVSERETLSMTPSSGV